MKSDQKAVLILSGYNIRAVIAFCRWASAYKINFHIIARNADDPIFKTAFKDRVAITRTAASLTSEEFCSWVTKIRDQYSYDRLLVLPSTEFLNRFLLEHREVLEAAHCTIPLVESRLYATISDKHEFAKLCESAGLDVPVEFAEIPAILPFVAKPRTYCADDGRQLVPHLINTETDLEIFSREENSCDYFFQAFVNGESHYLLAYIGKRGGDILFSQENLVQQARGGSIILARLSDFHRSEVARRYVDMLHEADYSGLIMIEVRLDKASGRYSMIEANPRLWGPMQFSIDNNVDLFGALLRDYGFEIRETNDGKQQSNYYFWSGGTSEKAQPLAYHNYSYEQFMKELPAIRNQDIFSRNDTYELYMTEPKMEEIHEK